MSAPQTDPKAPPYQLPEWETPVPKPNNASPTLRQQWATLTRPLDRILPPHRRYCTLSRRVFVIVVLIAVMALLALVLGLAIGLSARRENRELPLGAEQYTGDLTYYGTGLGACGIVSSDGDDIVSISHFTFDAVAVGGNPNANPLCGKKLRAVRNGRSVDLTVVDRCTGCQPTDIDVSPAAFRQLADSSLGRTPVTWAWLQPVPSPND